MKSLFFYFDGPNTRKSPYWENRQLELELELELDIMSNI